MQPAAPANGRVDYRGRGGGRGWSVAPALSDPRRENVANGRRAGVGGSTGDGYSHNRGGRRRGHHGDCGETSEATWITHGRIEGRADRTPRAKLRCSLRVSAKALGRWTSEMGHEASVASARRATFGCRLGVGYRTLAYDATYFIARGRPATIPIGGPSFIFPASLRSFGATHVMRARSVRPKPKFAFLRSSCLK